jgi:hypothetical protein
LVSASKSACIFSMRPDVRTGRVDGFAHRWSALS